MYHPTIEPYPHLFMIYFKKKNSWEYITVIESYPNKYETLVQPLVPQEEKKISITSLPSSIHAVIAEKWETDKEMVNINSTQSWAGKMAQGGARFAAKPDTLNLVPETHMVEIETRLPKVVLRPSHTPTHGYTK